MFYNYILSQCPNRVSTYSYYTIVYTVICYTVNVLGIGVHGSKNSTRRSNYYIVFYGVYIMYT